MQFDPKFLELPPSMLLATFNKIPTRPTAQVELKYEEESNYLKVLVTEANNVAMTNFVARYAGSELELSANKYDPIAKQTEEIWYSWDEHHRFSSEEEALCWMVLLASDVGCPGQARVDMPKARTSPLWSKLWTEIKHLHPVASVMLM